MTAKVCFVDSVCWIALINKADRLHAQANTVYQQLFEDNYRMLTTTAVLNETANALSVPRFRAAVVALHERLKQSARVNIMVIDQPLWEAGWQLFADRPDKEWSLTDCLSMIVCQSNDIATVLTTDHHFTQAGFSNLLVLP